MNKLLLYLFFLLMISSCGISNKDVEKKSENLKTIFEKAKPIKEELNPSLNIKLNKLKKGEVFVGNNTNNLGNVNFQTNFKKVSSYKFSSIEEFNFNQPELSFTNNESIVFF